MTKQTSSSTRAVVVTRASSGGSKFINPIRIYLLLADVQEGTVVIPRNATKARAYTYIRENRRAVRRVKRFCAKAEQLAADVNCGRIAFSQAVEQFNA
jgi:hypothetical protein